jgi:hypothetical protein
MAAINRLRRVLLVNLDSYRALGPSELESARPTPHCKSSRPLPR